MVLQYLLCYVFHLGISYCELYLKIQGPFTSSVKVNTATTLAILLTLKIMESLQNGLQPQSEVTLVFFNDSSIASVIAALL